MRVDVSKGGWVAGRVGWADGRVAGRVEWADGRVFEQVSGRVGRRKGGEWLGVGRRV